MLTVIINSFMAYGHVRLRAMVCRGTTRSSSEVLDPMLAAHFAASEVALRSVRRGSGRSSSVTSSAHLPSSLGLPEEPISASELRAWRADAQRYIAPRRGAQTVSPSCRGACGLDCICSKG